MKKRQFSFYTLRMSPVDLLANIAGVLVLILLLLSFVVCFISMLLVNHLRGTKTKVTTSDMVKEKEWKVRNIHTPHAGIFIMGLCKRRQLSTPSMPQPLMDDNMAPAVFQLIRCL